MDEISLKERMTGFNVFGPNKMGSLKIYDGTAWNKKKTRKGLG